MNIYANDAPDPSGYGEGQYALGIANVPEDIHAVSFVFISPLDLRGKWISATATHTQRLGFLRSEWQEFWYTTNTSEFGRAVEVR